MTAGQARLSSATLDDLPAAITRPAYDRTTALRGVVHLGIGAFHRAHQALVFDDCLSKGDARWAITGVSLRSPGVREALAPQDGLYSLTERSDGGEAIRVVGAVREVLVAPKNPELVVAAMADAATHIVTLTITEKGYKLDPATGALLSRDSGVAHDLADLSTPRTAAGFIVAALSRRRNAGLAPFTAISCDNLPGNGARLRAAVIAMAEAHDHGLAAWIGREGAFPATMVDRIVPATQAADLQHAGETLGVADAGAVVTEPFLQWVIEDRFAGPRPDFVTPGVTLTADVTPWENAKLCLLNGAHSGIAYLGAQAGIETVDAFVALAEGRRFVEVLWDEAAATLTPPAELDIAQYRAALMARFANPSLHHRTRQIAMDGSQKLPQRLLEPIAARRSSGKSFDALALAVAGWMRWVQQCDDSGAHHDLDDPLAASMALALQDAATPTERVVRLSSLESIFPPALAADRVIRAALIDALTALEDHGSLAWLRTRFGDGAL